MIHIVLLLRKRVDFIYDETYKNNTDNLTNEIVTQQVNLKVIF